MGFVTVFLFFSLFDLALSLTFLNVTDAVGLGRTAPSKVLTYGDFNADKATDILVVTANGKCVHKWNSYSNVREICAPRQCISPSCMERSQECF